MIRAELPTPDVVVVSGARRLLVFVDARLDQAAVDQALADLPAIMKGPGHALS